MPRVRWTPEEEKRLLDLITAGNGSTPKPWVRAGRKSELPLGLLFE